MRSKFPNHLIRTAVERLYSEELLGNNSWDVEDKEQPEVKKIH